MYLGRVAGCVWATIKNPEMVGQRMLVVQPLTPELQTTGKQLICLDCTGAGTGELIYYVKGKEASFPFLPAQPPTDAAVVGIVDSLHLQAPVPATPGGPIQKPSGLLQKPSAPTHKKGKR